jgi:hypothetical protein
VPAAFPANKQLPAPPVDILELDRGDLPGAQPEPHQQQQDREVAPANQPAPIAAGQKPSDYGGIEAAGQRAITQIGDRRDRPHQRRFDQASQVQVAQKRTQRAHEISGSRHAALGALARQERAHVRRAQPPQPIRALPAHQQQPRGRFIRIEHRVT